jgi:hypothetical protein
LPSALAAGLAGGFVVGTDDFDAAHVVAALAALPRILVVYI